MGSMEGGSLGNLRVPCGYPSGRSSSSLLNPSKYISGGITLSLSPDYLSYISLITSLWGRWVHSSTCCGVASPGQAWIWSDSLKFSVKILQNLVRPYWPWFIDVYNSEHPGSLRVVFWFTVVPHNYGALAHHLEVGSFHANIGFPFVSGTFLSSDKEIRRPRVVVDIFEVDVVDLSHIVFQVQENCSYNQGFDETPNDIDLRIIPQIQGLYSVYSLK